MTTIFGSEIESGIDSEIEYEIESDSGPCECDHCTFMDNYLDWKNIYEVELRNCCKFTISVPHDAVFPYSEWLLSTIIDNWDNLIKAVFKNNVLTKYEFGNYGQDLAFTSTYDIGKVNNEIRNIIREIWIRIDDNFEKNVYTELHRLKIIDIKRNKKINKCEVATIFGSEIESESEPKCNCDLCGVMNYYYDWKSIFEVELKNCCKFTISVPHDAVFPYSKWRLSTTVDNWNNRIEAVFNNNVLTKYEFGNYGQDLQCYSTYDIGKVNNEIRNIIRKIWIRIGNDFEKNVDTELRRLKIIDIKRNKKSINVTQIRNSIEN